MALPHPSLPCRAQWAPTALLIWTSGIWGMCRSYRPVVVLPSGCGTTSHADCGSHGSHVRHHPGHHEGDRVWGGRYPGTLQRSQYELGQRAHCGGDQLHHLWPHSDSPEEVASDGLHGSIIAILREENGDSGMTRSPYTLWRETREMREWSKCVLLDRSKHTRAQDAWVILMYSLALSVCDRGCAVPVGVRYVGWY